MQYIGMKDRSYNTKKIFEGDTVSGFNSNAQVITGYIEHVAPCYFVSTPHGHVSLGELKDIRVTGNIFKNQIQEEIK